MGWNGGGFGHMTFETGDGVAAWKAASVSHDQWTDWCDWFERPVAPRFVVGEQLAQLRRLHDPTGSGYFVLEEQGPTVDFAFDTGEDIVRDFSGTIAAALRAAAEHGARGTFYFLGTAGAEYDFTYKLELANGLSTLESLGEREIATIYEGDAYRAFLQRVMDALGITEDGDVVVPPRRAVGEGEGEGEGGAGGELDAEREAIRQKAAAFKASLSPAAAQPPEVKPPAVKPPAVKAANKPAAKATKKPANKPAAKKSAATPAKKSAAKKSAAKKPAAKKPAAKKPAAKKPAAKKPATNKRAANKRAR